VIPGWVDRHEYPFEPRGLTLPAGRISYVDEGEGQPIVMVHGTPTWSFLYRHLVKALRERYRCVAPDNLGFGLSDKPAGASYRPQDQAANLAALIDTLGLKNITLVVHDFGGPIGLSYAIERPENVRRLVLFNTWMWSFAGQARYRWLGRALGSPVGRVLYERFGFALNVMFRSAVTDKRRYTPAVQAQYARPLASAAERRATWVYARELLGSSEWFDGLWRRRERIAAIPALLIWGTSDPAFGDALPRWRSVFERVRVLELPRAGHAPPEERPEEIVPVIARFLEEEDRR
jgi:haloalkane dehalogenase